MALIGLCFSVGIPLRCFALSCLWAISSLVEIGLGVAEYEVVKGVVFRFGSPILIKIPM